MCEVIVYDFSTRIKEKRKNVRDAALGRAVHGICSQKEHGVPPSKASLTVKLQVFAISKAYISLTLKPFIIFSEF